MQMFINGTSYDATNAMGFTYVVDYLVVSGQGSKTYSSTAFNYDVVGMNGTMAVPTSQATITAWVDGNTLYWNSNFSLTLVVTATAKAGADSSYSGFALYDYTSGYRTVKLAPDFTPFILSNVVDLAAGAQYVDTGVPVSSGIIGFVRNRFDQGGNLSRSFYSTSNVNGQWRLTFGANANAFPIRLYVFANKLPPIPSNGFYIYRDGNMVWHNNCLPLDLKWITTQYVESTTPIAVTTGVTAFMYQPQDPSYPLYGFERFMCSGCGILNGRWRTSNTEVYQATMVNVPTIPRGWVVGTKVAYIDCVPYDTYYPYSL